MQVEIWSDVVCPWCYIGKRRFESALARFAHRDEIDLLWRSFELDPSAPPMRQGDSAARLAAKYGISREQALANHAHITALAAKENLTYHLAESRSGNTFNAHRLLHLAREYGVQDAAKERLMLAYFTEREPIGDPETLVRLIAEVGVNAEDASAVLRSERFTDEVRQDETEARELGINGVPFFVLDRRYGVSGAQPADVLLQALDQAWADSHPKLIMAGVAASADGPACTEESCEV